MGPVSPQKMDKPFLEIVTLLCAELPLNNVIAGWRQTRVAHQSASTMCFETGNKQQSPHPLTNDSLSITWNPSNCAKSPRKGSTSAANTYTSTMCPTLLNRSYSLSTAAEPRRESKATCGCKVSVVGPRLPFGEPRPRVTCGREPYWYAQRARLCETTRSPSSSGDSTKLHTPGLRAEYSRSGIFSVLTARKHEHSCRKQIIPLFLKSALSVWYMMMNHTDSPSWMEVMKKVDSKRPTKYL